MAPDSTRSEVRDSDSQRRLAEHRVLKRTAERLRTIAGWEPPGGYDEEIAVLMHSEIEDFREQLIVHFRFEESGGYFRELIVAHPRFVNHVTLLAAQHQEMLQMLDDIIERHGTLSSGDLERRVSLLLETLAGHERAENELLQEATLADLGGGD